MGEVTNLTLSCVLLSRLQRQLGGKISQLGFDVCAQHGSLKAVYRARSGLLEHEPLDTVRC